MSKQVESVVVPIKIDKLFELFLNPKLDVARCYPNLVKSFKFTKGGSMAEGDCMRLEMYDGTYIEQEITKIDKHCHEFTYTLLKTDMPCYKGLDKVVEIWKYKPITFEGDLFK